MKTLFLLRHGKSSWVDRDVPDFERPLKTRGIKASKLIGQYMAEKGKHPDVILCSQSVRTQETLKHFLETNKGDPDIKIIRPLYLAGPDRILKQIAKVPDSANSVMIIGHNPGLQFLAMELTSGSNPHRRRVGKKFPTGALAELTVNQATWKPLMAGTFSLEDYVMPKDLAD